MYVASIMSIIILVWQAQASRVDDDNLFFALISTMIWNIPKGDSKEIYRCM